MITFVSFESQVVLHGGDETVLQIDDRFLFSMPLYKVPYLQLQSETTIKNYHKLPVFVLADITYSNVYLKGAHIDADL